MTEPCVVVHGGAWAIPEYLTEASRNGVRQAALSAWKVLELGGSAVDAVEAAVQSLEDDPAFDAGTGSVLTSTGDIQMDAIIMNGNNLSSGAVGCIHNVKHPVSVARCVMEKTDHCLLVGKGADDFALEVGFPRVNQADLETEEARREYEIFKQYKSSVTELFNGDAKAQSLGHDTVGAVARDRHGHVAAATSTGGITAQRPGRVGDTPLVGAGAYADSEVGAVSTTGHGESIMKVCLAKNVIDRMRDGSKCKEAAQKSIDFMERRVGGRGGVIVLSNGNDHANVFSTERMAWASVERNEVRSGLEPGECVVQKLP